MSKKSFRYVALTEYFNNGKLKIIISPYLEPIPQFLGNTYVFKLCWWYIQDWQTPAFFDPDKVIICCNSQEELDNLHDNPCRSIFLNHNFALNYENFKITNTSIIYDAVMNARGILLKRHALANKINNLALVLGHLMPCHAKEVYDVKNLVPHTFYNNPSEGDPWLEAPALFDLFNRSCCGLSLSALEGACYSSSEYLLSGLPVVSTRSKGGRDVWYNEINHRICDDNPDSVKECVDYFVYNQTQINREQIRRLHIEQQHRFFETFIQETDRIFKINNIQINARDYFEKTLAHYLTTGNRHWLDWITITRPLFL